jgi:hypothetical protein
MKTTNKTTEMKDRKAMLSLLWIFVMFKCPSTDRAIVSQPVFCLFYSDRNCLFVVHCLVCLDVASA